MTSPMKWTVVQHSAKGYAGDNGFKHNAQGDVEPLPRVPHKKRSSKKAATKKAATSRSKR